MNIKDLKQVLELTTNLQRIKESYHNNFKDKRNTIRILVSLHTRQTSDAVPSEDLGMDLDMEGPIAALIDQAYRKKLNELEQELRNLGVEIDINDPVNW